MSLIDLVPLSIDASRFPCSLFAGHPFRLGGPGLSICRSVKAEAEACVQAYVRAAGCGTEGVFLRLDLFIAPERDRVAILEVNGRLVDGWGTAFQLAFAGGQPRDEVVAAAGAGMFPRCWRLSRHNRAYKNDFAFTLRTLCELGVSVEEQVDDAKREDGSSVYFYGWDRPQEDRSLVPAHAFQIERKEHLARFSRDWHGRSVTVPLGYHRTCAAWDEIPRDRVIFKFCEKGSDDSLRAGTSVVYPSESGRGRFARQCYERGTVMAQQMVPTIEIGGKMCQLVLLTSASRVLAGYVLWAPCGTRVITDAYEHAPLIWV
ncbi:MAG: hypothetical protein Q7R83_03830 [bacterium]|nr:hypothetical protein [bacterium]